MASDEELRQIFDSLDKDHNGRLEVAELQAALEELGLPSGASYIRDLLGQYDRNTDKEVSFEEFQRYVKTKEAAIAAAFRRMDVDGDGQLDAGEVLQAVRALGMAATADEAERMVALLDRNGDRRIDQGEFRRFVVLLPGAQVSSSHILSAWIDSTDWVHAMEYRLCHVPPGQPWERFFAGGVAGAVSRTVAAPLERLRTIMMADKSAMHLGPVVKRMWSEGGLRGLFKGNFATLVKVFPNNAIQYAVYDGCKDLMLLRSGDHTTDLDSSQKVVAGLLASAAACTATYPLEALRTQISVAAGASGSYLSLARGALAAHGPRGLYQGYTASLANNSLSGALGFASYEAFLSLYTRFVNKGERPSPSVRGGLCGLAAFWVTTVTMPLENASRAHTQVQRRLQVQGRPGFATHYRGPLDCAAQMLRHEGVSSFWRGSLGSYLKVVPSIAATRLLYEGIVELRGVGGVRRYRTEG